jgi:hypothetical protein
MLPNFPRRFAFRPAPTRLGQIRAGDRFLRLCTLGITQLLAGERSVFLTRCHTTPLLKSYHIQGSPKPLMTTYREVGWAATKKRSGLRWQFYPMLAVPRSLLDILDSDAAPLPQALSRVFDTAQKTQVVLEPIIEPIILGPKPAGFPLRVMTIPSSSASRKNRERSFWISDSGTRLTPDLRDALARRGF